MTVAKLSDTYHQLARLFESLEAAHFVGGTDFGENLTGCFKWFLSPTAVHFLEERSFDFWENLKKNPKLIYSLEPWHGHQTQGASIALK